jgi:hypothetical protein
LNKYYDEGVRTFYLAHKINSRLSGADIFMPQSTAGGRAIRISQALAGCFYYDDNVGNFPLQGRLGENLCDNTNQCGANAFIAIFKCLRPDTHNAETTPGGRAG